MKYACVLNRLALLVAFVGEGPWMFFGAVFGWFLPVLNWFGIDFRLWAFLVAALVALDAVLAARILRIAFREAPSNGWSISRIIGAASVRRTEPRSRFLGYAAVALVAKGMILGGILLGQAISIYASIRR